jgi:hypothetical protein
MNVDTIAKTVQVVSVVIGVVISVLTFDSATKRESENRRLDIETRRFEAAKPFRELRQKLYIEALKAAAVLVNPEGRSQAEIQTARRRFRELYVVELSMVEEVDVETEMVDLAEKIDPELVPLTAAQRAALHLAHALRDSFVIDWGVATRRDKPQVTNEAN